MRRVVAAVALTLLIAAGVVSCAPFILGGDRYQRVESTGRFDGTVAVFVSGDAGIRFGMGRPVTQALAARGIPVVAISSPTAFANTRTRAQVDAVLVEGMRRALAVPGAKRVVLMGQSFGADMLSVTAPDLPPALRPHIAAVILVVPARTVFFRADPLGLAYRGTPDAHPAAGMRTLTWAPVTCIQGAREDESLCPALAGTPTQRIVLPGGHFLAHDDARLIATIMARLQALKLA